MALLQSISRLGGWEGYRLVEIELEKRGAEQWCVIRLEPRQRLLRRCSGCGRRVHSIHDVDVRRVRDLPVFEYLVERCCQGFAWPAHAAVHVWKRLSGSDCMPGLREGWPMR